MFCTKYQKSEKLSLALGDATKNSKLEEVILTAVKPSPKKQEWKEKLNTSDVQRKT